MSIWHNACDIRASPDERGSCETIRKKSGWHSVNRPPRNKTLVRLMALVAEINRLLAEKQQRLGKQEPELETDA